jgi:site-specific DNA-cytosine methylase
MDTDHPNISLYADILKVTPEMILEQFGQPDIIWASPPCTSYSIAAISHHRTAEPNGNLLPKSEFAKVSDEIVKHTLYLIERLRPKFWYIENPVGGMRKTSMMYMLPRYKVTYCQYELDKPVEKRRMKPTDIWTNHYNPQFKPTCSNGDPCHEGAKRGSKTGTQGLKNAKDRSVIPHDLCLHIAEISEMKKGERH